MTSYESHEGIKEEPEVKETYTIPESERENVLKILARYQKKAMAYGTSLTVDAGEPYATKRNVYE